MNKYRYLDREKSWLNFNERVLQEAADESVPLLDRFRFLGIFSNNLDEFFRVRFAAIRRLSLSGDTGEKILGGITAKKLLKEIETKNSRDLTADEITISNFFYNERNIKWASATKKTGVIKKQLQKL